MSRHSGITAIVTALVIAAHGVAHAQTPRLPRGFRVEQKLPSAIIVVGGSMIVVIGGRSAVLNDERPSEPFDSTLVVMRRIADSSGYKVAMGADYGTSLVDSAGYAVYSPPPGTTVGLILLAPGRRPQLIPRALTLRGFRHALERHRAGHDEYFVQPIPSGG